MIKAEDIRKINPKEYSYLTKDENGDIKAWFVKPFEYMTNWFSYGNIGCYNLGKLEVKEFAGKEWHECLIDFGPDYSGALGCVGWFWDINENNKVLGILTHISLEEGCAGYECDDRGIYCCFRPVKPDELKFYKEK